MRQFMKSLPQAKKKLTINTINLFASYKINALPMKLYSDDDDVDIVIINKDQYKDASRILLSNAWFIKNNKSKLRERDKNFFKHKNVPYVIHLHKAFSWNTVPYLDSKKLWERRRMIFGILIPSIEDELLIIAAHSLFENQYIKKEEIIYGRELLENKYDLDYMENHAKSFNWENGLKVIVKKLKENNPSLSIKELILVKVSKLKEDFRNISFRQYFVELINYFCVDWIWNYRIMLQKKFLKRPIIISLSGVDGSGKTTEASFLYQSLKKAGKNVKVIHIGTTPLIKQNLEKKWLVFNLIEYIIFIKDALQIIFFLIRNINFDVIIFDRYIFDTLVKTAYKQHQGTINSLLLSFSLTLIPKPNISFLLITSPEISNKRDLDHSAEYHKKKYFLYRNLLQRVPSVIRIETGKNKEEVAEIIEAKVKTALRP